jgi:photosystem II stability/assembly factor-like uncharacterized protein
MKPRRIFLVILLAALPIVHGGDVSFGLLKSGDLGETWSEATGTFRSNRINSLLVVSNNVWAAADHGLFLSRNDGFEWSQTSELKNQRILALVAAEKMLFASSQRSGLWRSVDHGNSWALASPLHSVRALEFSQGSVFAGDDAGRIFVSSDSGANWVEKSEGLPANAQIFQLAATGAGRIYAALYSKGLYELQNDRWIQRGNETLPKPFVLMADDRFLLAGHNPGGIFRSSDNGASWKPITDGLPQNAPSWTFQKVGSALFYGTTGISGLYSSRDAGQTWRPIARRQLQRRAVIAMAGNGKIIFAATADSANADSVTLDFDLNYIQIFSNKSDGP